MEIIHLVPIKDLCEHKSDGSPCNCEPQSYYMEVNEDWIIVVQHYSWDLREAYERLIEDDEKNN